MTQNEEAPTLHVGGRELLAEPAPIGNGDPQRLCQVNNRRTRHPTNAQTDEEKAARLQRNLKHDRTPDHSPDLHRDPRPVHGHHDRGDPGRHLHAPPDHAGRGGPAAPRERGQGHAHRDRGDQPGGHQHRRRRRRPALHHQPGDHHNAEPRGHQGRRGGRGDVHVQQRDADVQPRSPDRDAPRHPDHQPGVRHGEGPRPDVPRRRVLHPGRAEGRRRGLIDTPGRNPAE